MKKFLYLISLSVVILSGCERNNFNVDVADIDVNLQINRFDIELFNLSGDSIFYAIPMMQTKYNDFFIDYNVKLIGVGLPDQREYFDNLSEFFFYCDQMDLYNEVLKVFPKNDDFIKNELTKAFKYYKYYFPNDTIPTINTCISGFNLSTFTGTDYVGISLDKYLGKSYQPYSGMFEGYLKRRMTKKMIPVDVMKVICTGKYPFNDSVNTVLTNMIYQGRIQYFLDAMLPNTDDTLKWGYKYSQLKWAQEYEENIWEYMVAEEVLFSNKNMDIKTYTDEAPFTTPFMTNSAPRAGNFIGYKIVQDFMKNNEEYTLEQLLKITDYMFIYNNSYYQP